MSITTTLDNLARDVRYSARGLGRNPLLALIAVITLASYLPARRASAVNPAEWLAAE